MVLPCGNPPHRAVASATGEQRLEMLRLACRELGKVEVDDREVQSDSPSYTYLTLKALQKENPDALLFITLGWDSLVSFNTWYRWQEILQMACLLVVKRSEGEQKIPDEIYAPMGHVSEIEPAINTILELPFEEVSFSSTGIRQALAQGNSLEGLIAPQVLNYIVEHKLYES